jgi:hypothetical protein
MPRNLLSGVAMTSAERQQRRRYRFKQYRTSLSGERLFRLDLAAFIASWRQCHPGIVTTREIERALEAYGSALFLNEYRRQNGIPGDCFEHYLDPHRDDLYFRLEADRPEQKINHHA